ncbi:MAG: hypothetical protein KHX55_00470 [Proteobacteria bacterium]|nr:hypothetical protein [Pseudomonadota bacterium]
MKNFLCLFVLAGLICGCSEQDDNAAAPQQAAVPAVEIDENTVFTFDINTLKPGCDNGSDIICAINNSIKCTINPQFEDCEANKELMPRFVFMEDESLQRPTSQSYKITKLKPRADGAVEVFTQSTCNGNWFGLCNGNIIFVMENKDGRWVVKDLYALEN